jgi:hypothetical protein
MAWGTGCSIERTTGWPFCEDILLSHPKDMFCEPGLRNPYAPHALTMETGRTYDLLVRCHYYWEVSG